jgi:hypothetical protein
MYTYAPRRAIAGVAHWTYSSLGAHRHDTVLRAATTRPRVQRRRPRSPATAAAGAAACLAVLMSRGVGDDARPLEPGCSTRDATFDCKPPLRATAPQRPPTAAANVERAFADSSLASRCHSTVHSHFGARRTWPWPGAGGERVVGEVALDAGSEHRAIPFEDRRDRQPGGLAGLRRSDDHERRSTRLGSDRQRANPRRRRGSRSAASRRAQGRHDSGRVRTHFLRDEAGSRRWCDGLSPARARHVSWCFVAGTNVGVAGANSAW